MNYYVLYISPLMKGQKIDRVELSRSPIHLVWQKRLQTVHRKEFASCEFHWIHVKRAYPLSDRKKLIGSQDTKFICQKGLNSLVLLMRCLDAARRSIKINRVISVKVTSDREIHGNHTITTQCRCIIINAVFQRVIYCASLDYLV